MMEKLDDTQLKPYEASLRLVTKLASALLKGYDFSEADQEDRDRLASAIKYLEEHPGEPAERQSDLLDSILEAWTDYYKADNELTKAKMRYDQELAFAIDRIRISYKSKRAKSGEPNITVAYAEAEAHKTDEKVKSALEGWLAARITAGTLKTIAEGLDKTYWDKHNQYKTGHWIETRRSMD